MITKIPQEKDKTKQSEKSFIWATTTQPTLHHYVLKQI